MNTAENCHITAEDVQQDVDVMLWSIKLESIKRFFHLRFWEQETRDSEYSIRVESSPRLESVADHSWHVSDIILLVGRHFSYLDINKCLRLALLHDKLEIITGDFNPIGRDGTGIKTYAFNDHLLTDKSFTEKQAIEKYLSLLPPAARVQQGQLLYEMLECTTKDALFVKAIDKLQPLLYIYIKKRGVIHDKHLIFSLKYAKTSLKYFPHLEPYYTELRDRLIKQIANRRSASITSIEMLLGMRQMSLFDQ